MAAHALVSPLQESTPQVDRATLAFLRVAAGRSRCLARADLFEACAALSVHPSHEADALAALVFAAFSGQRGLPRLRLFQPNADELSFDERWLISALDAAAREDFDSLNFLIVRRVPRHLRRNIARLIVSLSRALAAIASQSVAKKRT